MQQQYLVKISFASVLRRFASSDTGAPYLVEISFEPVLRRFASIEDCYEFLVEISGHFTYRIEDFDTRKLIESGEL